MQVSQPIVIATTDDLQVGDRLTVGTNHRSFERKTGNGTYIFSAPDLSPMELTESDLLAFAVAGFLWRVKWERLSINPNHKKYRSLESEKIPTVKCPFCQGIGSTDGTACTHCNAHGFYGVNS